MTKSYLSARTQNQKLLSRPILINTPVVDTRDCDSHSIDVDQMTTQEYGMFARLWISRHRQTGLVGGG